MSETNAPYKHLGDHLKYVREQSKESLAEVSGAVEIDEAHLERIEAGQERPAEDILLLLISHFGVKDGEAVQLWELAQYDSDFPDDIKVESETSQLGGKPMIMLLATDVRTMYSDGVTVNVTPAGVTLEFSQVTSKDNQSPVSRVGMSHQQADVVLQTIQQALLSARYQKGPKQLPPNSTL